MPNNPEAIRLNIEFYRKAAKSLLKAAQTGDTNALERIARHAGKPLASVALHHAQLTIAREGGFPSWPRFQAFLVESALDFQSLVVQFMDAALEDLRAAERMLERHPEIARAGLYTALILGDSQTVMSALAESPAFALAKGGPRDWPPLLYVCHSRFAGRKSRRAADLVTTAQILLENGADPNAFYVDERWPDGRLSCLYAATGPNNNPALARVLLAAGAQPDDTESLYHSTEHADLDCMRLLLEYNATPRGTNSLKHMLDREDIEGVRLLLAVGADPNEVNPRNETALHWAVWRARGPEIVAALLDAGAAIDARRIDGRTAYAIAVISGQRETSALLESRGSDTEISALDRFVGDCATTAPSDLPRMLANSPQRPLPGEYERLLPEFASSHSVPAVRGLLAAGVPIDTIGHTGCTALHWACWKGYADLVGLLISGGASLTIEDHVYHATQPGWFWHGLENYGETDGDYGAVLRLLIAAGVKVTRREMPTGNAAVDTVLREHGLL